MSNQDKYNEESSKQLRKKLEYNTPDEDGWNVPSDKVWGGLSNELSASRNASRRNTRNYILIISTLAVVALMLARECTNKNRIQHLQKELQQTKDSYEQLQKNCDEKTSFHQDKINKDGEALLAASSITPSEGKTDLKDNYIHYQSRKGIITQSLPSLAGEKLVFPTTLFPQKKGNEIFNTPKTIASLSDSQLVEFAPLANIPTLQIAPHFTNTHLLAALSKNPKSKKHLPLIISAFTGIANTGNRLSGMGPNTITRQKALTGWQTGLGIELGIQRRWSLLTGLYYHSHRIQTDYALAVPFTHLGEYLHNDGNYDNQYNHSLPSALGDYSLQLLLSRESNATIDEGEIIRLDLNVRQHIHQLGIPLNVRYALGQGRWQMGIRTGVTGKYTLSLEAEDNPGFVSHHGAIHQRHTTVGNPSFSDLSKFTMTANLGLDVRYRFTPQLGLSVDADWQRALNPIYKDENVQSYLRSFGINAGLHFWIK